MTTTPTPRIVLPGEPLVEGDTALRPWRDADLPSWCRPARTRRSCAGPGCHSAYSEADARAYLRQRYDAAFAGLTAPFAVVDASDGQLLGSISLMRFAWAHARGEVGYWLAACGPRPGPRHPSGPADLRLGLQLAAPGADRPDGGDRQPGLPAASRERAGFTREAVLRSYMRGTFERQDMVMFGLLRGELD